MAEQNFDIEIKSCSSKKENISKNCQPALKDGFKKYHSKVLKIQYMNATKRRNCKEMGGTVKHKNIFYFAIQAGHQQN